MRTERKGLVCGSWLLAGGFILFVAFIGCGGGGGGGGSATVPGAPANLTANPGDNSVTLNWSPVTGAASYNVYRGSAPGVTKTSGTKVSGVQSPNTVTGLVNGTAYYFVVTAVNAAGEGGLSAERTATPSAAPPPAAPNNIRAAAGDNQVTVSWDPVSGATSYNLYRGTSPGVTKATGTKISGVTSPSVVSPLTNGTTIYFVVTAVGTGGESAESFEVSATPAATPPPAAPAGVSATPGNGQATVSWSAVTGATSYNIYVGISPGVTRTTGAKASGVTSPSVVSPLTNGTKYYFVVTAVGAGGESTESAEVFATPVAPPAAFSQADLAGTWDMLFFTMGNTGWFRGTATANSSGGISGISGLDSSGSTSVPPDGTITWTISASGVVSESGVRGDPSFRGQMSSNKLLVIGTDNGWSPGSAGMRVLRKRTGTSFSNADLANKTFTYHQLGTGTDNNWYYGAGSTDSLGQVTLASFMSPSGPLPPDPSAGTLTVNSFGIMTDSTGPSWYGVMTDDKKNIFAIDTWGANSYMFMVINITGQSFTQSDLAGTYNFGALRNALNGVWSYGAFSIDTSGNGNYLSYVDSTGGATPPNFTRTLSSTGVFTDPGDASLHGQLSYNKDLLVRTNTNSSGRFGLSISFK